MKNKVIGIIVAIILILVAIFAPNLFNQYEIDINEDILRVYYFNVGQADCTLIVNNGKTMLIDGGNEADGPNIAKYIKDNLGIKSLDYIIVTHADLDHIAGVDKIIDSMETIGTVYMPYTITDNKETRELINSVHNKGQEIETPNVNSIFELGKADFTIKSIRDGRKIDDNKSSIVLEMEYGEKNFLFMGDYEELSNADTKDYPEELYNIDWNKTDVLKVSHHGSKNGTTLDFLELVVPNIAIISAGYNDRLTHPDGEVLDMLKEVNKDIQILITKNENVGTILIESDGTKISEPQFKNLNLDGNR